MGKVKAIEANSVIGGLIDGLEKINAETLKLAIDCGDEPFYPVLVSFDENGELTFHHVCRSNSDTATSTMKPLYFRPFLSGKEFAEQWKEKGVHMFGTYERRRPLYPDAKEMFAPVDEDFATFVHTLLKQETLAKYVKPEL